MRKNWKSRFFVLERGMLTYYEGQDTKNPSQGKTKKGEVKLRLGMTCTENASILTIRGADIGERDLKIDIQSVSERVSWQSAIRDHIQYKW